jgi:hypothetical protein
MTSPRMMVPPTVVQCAQTSVRVTLRIMVREEVGQSLQGRVRFLERRRFQHGNSLDRSTGAISARRWWMGIFAVASELTRRPNQHLRLDPTCAMPKGVSSPISIPIFTLHRSKKGRFMKKKSRIEMEREIVSYVRREMDKPRLTESVRNDLSATAAPDTEKPATHSALA